MPWYVMDSFESYAEARREFEWDLPETFNPAIDLCRKHEDPTRTALSFEPGDSTSGDSGDSLRQLSFQQLDERSDKLASGLASLGVDAGDRVGVVLPQSPANPISHLALWKLGAITVPLTVLFGRDALQYRLADSGATAVIVDADVRKDVDAIRESCPDLDHVIERNSPDDADTIGFAALLSEHDTGIDAYESTPETPSAIMYTSGSTGPPKGVLHSHALWLGRAAAAYNYFDQGLDDATLWTPADWAWGAALGGTVFAAWHYGCTVVAQPRTEFDPEAVIALLATHDVTHSFMPPTALRMLSAVENPAARFDFSLETIAAAGEPLTPELLDWIDEALPGVTLNEFYGQTELNLCVGNCSHWFSATAGSMGKPLPGYDVAILDPKTRERLPEGETGEIAVRPHDRRVFFDEYWGLPEKTAAKQVAEQPGSDGEGGETASEAPWFVTGDLATRDDEGYLHFVARTDDVILSRGYRVGPTEVERAILDHPIVEQVGVVGQPDETLGEAITAFVQPRREVDEPGTIKSEIRDRVRERLAAYEYPETIHFVDDLPTTSTGKIRRKSLRESR
jgi:acetyl-CoA synthetase